MINGSVDPFNTMLGAEMNHQILIVIFVAAFMLEFAAFGMQRATLLLSREAEIPYQVVAALLPYWFPAVWVLRITKWGVLIGIAFSWSWGVAIGLLIADSFLAAVLPIPYGMYVPSFRKRIEQIKQIDFESGEFLERVLNASKILST